MADLHRRPLVVKVGGGLLAARGAGGLHAALADVRERAAVQPVLLVPGGGRFADAVREVDTALGLGDDVAHRLALGAMDQFGEVLLALLPGARPGDLRGGWTGVRVLRAVAALDGRPEIPRTWEVTSDSLAVDAAAAVGAREAVLLKAVDGLGVPRLTATGLRERQASGQLAEVDRGLPDAIGRAGVRVRVRVRAPGDRRGGTLILPD